jgi:hypothetical protein
MFVARQREIVILPAMETRRINFLRTAVGGLVSGLAFLPTVFWTFLAMGPGCIPGSVSGDSPDGGTTAVMTALACSQTPSGCLCATRDDLPDDLSACSRASVAAHVGEQGICCSNADLCACEGFACKSDATLGFCQCGPMASFPAALVASASDSCPATAGQKCCLTTETRVCICSAGDCDSGAMLVPSCTLASVAVCGNQQQSPASCK